MDDEYAQDCWKTLRKAIALSNDKGEVTKFELLHEMKKDGFEPAFTAEAIENFVNKGVFTVNDDLKYKVLRLSKTFLKKGSNASLSKQNSKQ